MQTCNSAPLTSLLASCPPDPRRVPWTRCSCGAPLRSDGLSCSSCRIERPVRRLQFYATWTGTLRNLQAMNAAGIRLLTGPDQLGRRGDPPLPYAIDNGAWGSFTAGRAFDGDLFRKALSRWSHGADWAVLPDIVAGGSSSLDLSLSWMDEVLDAVPLALLAVQDGMRVSDIGPLLSEKVGIFVGGSTEWKWQTMEAWAALARDKGAVCHVGRVNTARRIRQCINAGATSCDGTSPSRFAVNSPKLDKATQTKPQMLLSFRGTTGQPRRTNV